ncbi:hypothetical protein ABEO76_21790 [Bacillus anthracis]|uniref:hypothetical protein n=1 Tax=Bacillus anthracis TaxID=1392 RepID=UPI003D25E8D5
MDFQQNIKKTFYNKPFNREAVLNHLRDFGYNEVSNEDREGYHRFLFMQSGKQKTLFMKSNDKGVVKYIKVQEGRSHLPKNDSKTFSNLIKLIFVFMIVGCGYWFISHLDSDTADREEKVENPYNRDYDGDGIKGTKSDNDIYRKHFK